jgi:hypothetical protein
LFSGWTGCHPLLHFSFQLIWYLKFVHFVYFQLLMDTTLSQRNICSVTEKLLKVTERFFQIICSTRVMTWCTCPSYGAQSSSCKPSLNICTLLWTWSSDRHVAIIWPYSVTNIYWIDSLGCKNLNTIHF